MYTSIFCDFPPKIERSVQKNLIPTGVSTSIESALFRPVPSILYPEKNGSVHEFSKKTSTLSLFPNKIIFESTSTEPLIDFKA